MIGAVRCLPVVNVAGSHLLPGQMERQPPSTALRPGVGDARGADFDWRTKPVLLLIGAPHHDAAPTLNHVVAAAAKLAGLTPVWWTSGRAQ